MKALRTAVTLGVTSGVDRHPAVVQPGLFVWPADRGDDERRSSRKAPDRRAPVGGRPVRRTTQHPSDARRTGGRLPVRGRAPDPVAPRPPSGRGRPPGHRLRLVAQLRGGQGDDQHAGSDDVHGGPLRRRGVHDARDPLLATGLDPPPGGTGAHPARPRDRRVRLLPGAMDDRSPRSARRSRLVAGCRSWSRCWPARWGWTRCPLPSWLGRCSPLPGSRS
jgi:hypothetical protein